MRPVTKKTSNKSQHNRGSIRQPVAPMPDHSEMAYSAKGPLQQILERDSMHAAQTANVNDILTAPPYHRG